MTKTTVTALTIGSTINYLTRTSVLTSTAFTVAPSTAPIIVPFGTFMTRLMDTPTIQGLVIVIMATAMVIGVINTVSDGGRFGAPVGRTLAILRCGLSYEERNWNVQAHDHDRYACGFGDQPACYCS